MQFRPNFPRRSNRLSLLALPLLALPAVAQTTMAQPAVEQTVTPPGMTESVVVGGGPMRAKPTAKNRGMSVAIVGAVDTTGNVDNARAALKAANSALNMTPGYSAKAISEYPALSADETAKAMANLDWGYPFAASDYQKVGKSLKVQRAMTISVTPNGGGYDALAELFDTKTGGLIGRGTSTSAFNATEETALSSAVQNAVIELGRTATFDGIVISRPNGYATRLSLGAMSGVRSGARVEYMMNGLTVAYGTVIDLGAGESLATIAPETALPQIYPNMLVRVVNNPSRERATLTAEQIQDKEFKRFETNFGVSAAIAGAIYLIFK